MYVFYEYNKSKVNKTVIDDYLNTMDKKTPHKNHYESEEIFAE